MSDSNYDTPYRIVHVFKLMYLINQIGLRTENFLFYIRIVH